MARRCSGRVLAAGYGDGYQVGELINEDKIILGGEESAESSIKDHYPEKDGILACLLAAEAVAAPATPLKVKPSQESHNVCRAKKQFD